MNRKASEPVRLLAILHAAHAAEGEVEARLNAIGLSLAKLVALRALAEAGEPVPLGQLAERLACVKSNITQLVDRLEADGLVARKPAPNDRRTKLASLTAAGRRAFEDSARVQHDAERDLLKRLSVDETRQLGSLLAKLGGVEG
jgi:DNA-binding MarR family transcriptional regulator